MKAGKSDPMEIFPQGTTRDTVASKQRYLEVWVVENFKYLSVFRMAGIDLYYGNIICSLLSESTLDRLTKKGFDRRAIRPVLREAESMQGGITDENINAILKNQNLMISIISRCCR